MKVKLDEKVWGIIGRRGKDRGERGMGKESGKEWWE